MRVDYNNGIYPIAYIVGEFESTQSLIWLLEQLGEDLDLYRNSNFTFIFEMHKAIESILSFLKYILFCFYEIIA